MINTQKTVQKYCHIFQSKYIIQITNASMENKPVKMTG